MRRTLLAAASGFAFLLEKMNKETIEVNTWPLCMCIPREALAKLIMYQWKHYGLKLDLMTDSIGEIESLAEIDRIMRLPPESPRQVV